ncbi:MAG: hypothetical protein ASARMPRED_008786 [Alectoria sarmentosa]|nr:MAG: hypothetical protein ASARMPRED_008786 [Alectoria sarmentosa]
MDQSEVSTERLLPSLSWSKKAVPVEGGDSPGSKWLRAFCGSLPAPPAVLLFLTSFTAISLLANIYLAFGIYHVQNPPVEIMPTPSKSHFAGLEKIYPQPKPYRNEYWLGNSTSGDLLWERISVNEGFVALDHVVTDSKGLPRGRDFPWDEQKSVYMLSAHHNLHCLKMFRVSIMEGLRGQPQSQSQDALHILHCLDGLRQDIICEADDTPLYMKAEPDKTTGDNQMRECRDFNALERWAKERTACFGYEHRKDGWRERMRIDVEAASEGKGKLVSDCERLLHICGTCRRSDIHVVDPIDAALNKSSESIRVILGSSYVVLKAGTFTATGSKAVDQRTASEETLIKLCHRSSSPAPKSPDIGRKVVHTSDQAAIKHGRGVTRREAATQECVYHHANGSNILRVLEAPGPPGGGLRRGYVFTDDGCNIAFNTVYEMDDWINDRLAFQKLRLEITPKARVDGREMLKDNKRGSAFHRSKTLMCHLGVAARIIILLRDGSFCFLDWPFARFYPSILEVCTLGALAELRGKGFESLLGYICNADPTSERQMQALSAVHYPDDSIAPLALALMSHEERVQILAKE